MLKQTLILLELLLDQQHITMGITDLGSYMAEQVCPAGAMITGFRVQLGSIYDKDRTGINGIQIACTDGSKSMEQKGPHGNWTSWKYCDGKDIANTSNYVIGFNYRSVANKESDIDAIAGTDINLTCNNGIILQGGGQDAGIWHSNDWTECKGARFLCGIQVQTQPDQHDDDDTGVNHVRFICCSSDSNTRYYKYLFTLMSQIIVCLPHN